MKQYNYKVVGVTFQARDGSDRQQNLKALFNEELETETYLRNHDIELEGYDYKGNDALAVFVDGKEIGNISADKVQDVAEIAQKASRCTVSLALNGHDVDDYETIVDQHKNKRDWKETDPYFDAEEADENYNAMMQDIKDNPIYSAVLHFIMEETDDIESTVSAHEIPSDSNKEAPLGLLYFNFIAGIVLVLMSLVLCLAKPVIGIIGIVIGAVLIVYSRKKIKEVKSKRE